MCCVLETIVLAFVTRAHATELAVNQTGNAQDFMDSLADKLVDKLIVRTQGSLGKVVDKLGSSADLGSTLLAKPGHLSIASRTGLAPRPLLTPRHHASFSPRHQLQSRQGAVRVNAEKNTLDMLDAALSESDPPPKAKFKKDALDESDVKDSQKDALKGVSPIVPEEGYSKLNKVFDEIRDLPPSQRAEASEDATKTVKEVLNGLKVGGHTKRWDSYPDIEKQSIFMGSLKQIGIKNPTAIGELSNRNDFNFLVGVVGSTSLLATIAGVALPGDWGFFVPYLLGGISLGVLAVGSTSPGLLAVAIDQFNRISPEYVERIARHEAAHFLVGYAMGVPVAGYSLGTMVAHIDFLEAKLEKKLYQQRQLTEQEMLPLACVSMAGAAAESLLYEDVQGQEADLRDLQLILNKVEPKLSAQQQMDYTRWSVWKAASILKENQKAYDALTEALKQNAPVTECFKAIESVPS